MHTSLDMTHLTNSHVPPPPSLQVKKQTNQIEQQHLKREIDLLKKDNLLMSQ
jgi:hypothetical protein